MNPVLRKDLLSLLRLRRVAVIQFAFLAVLAALVLATWPQQGVIAMASRGRDSLLLGLVIGQLALLALIVPGIASVSLVGEREANTWEMLYASRLSPARIIWGKTLSALAIPLLLLATGLPFAALLAFRGEMDVTHLALCYAILIVTAVLLAIGSLTISALCRQSASALVIAYVTVLVTCGGLLLPAAIMLKSQSGLAAQAIHYVRAASPVAAALSILRPELHELGGREGVDEASVATESAGERVVLLLPAWKIFFPVAGAIIAVCAAALVKRLSRPPVVEGSAAATGGGARAALRRRLTLIDARKPRRPLGRFNPVFGKETRTSQLSSGRWMIRVFYGSLALSMLLALMSLYGGVDHPDLLAYVSRVIVAFQFALVALVVPSLTSASVSGEIESDTFETLRLTRLTGGQIFWGKFLPAFLPALLPVVALLPAYGAIAFIDPDYVPFFLRLIVVVVTAVATCVTLGLTCSSFAGSSPRATVVSYMVAATLFALPLFAWWTSATHLAPGVARWLAMPSPLVVGLNLLPGETTSSSIGELWRQHVVVMLALCFAMLVGARLRLAHLLRHG
jgi:ABC-type transport system involved in multi-copper enzyme maturation permease subunit